MLRFVVADCLSGEVLGELYPNSWDLSEPLRNGPGPGTLTIPMPVERAKRLQVADLTQPLMRWVAVLDDGVFIWAGFIPRRPGRDGGNLRVSLLDWRGYFLGTPIPPSLNVRVTNSDQASIMRALALYGLQAGGAGKPAHFIVDGLNPTGVLRDLSATPFTDTYGSKLDEISNRDDGVEWWTYPTWTDDSHRAMKMHVAFAYPERDSSLTDVPVRLEYRVPDGGNAHDFTWPDGSDMPSRVYATGDGTWPDLPWSVDERAEVTTGKMLTYATVITISGATKKATLFNAAFDEVERGRGAEGEADFTIKAEALALRAVSVGDRARIVVDDGYVDADIGAARIIARQITGGTGQATVQRLTVDLEDDGYPGDTGSDDDDN